MLRRVRNDLDRAHGDEVMGNDGQREEQRSQQGPVSAFVAGGQRHRAAGQDDAEDYGRDHQAGGPSYPAGKLKRPHAAIVHAGDAAADDGAGHGRTSQARVAGGHAEPGAGNDARKQQ